MNDCGALTLCFLVHMLTLSAVYLFVFNLAIIPTSIENSLLFPSFGILDIICEMWIVPLCTWLYFLSSSIVIWLFNLAAKHALPTTLSCADLCSLLLLLEQILGVQRSITREMFSQFLRIKNVALPPFPLNVLSEVGLFLLKRNLCFCPKVKQLNC